jgi:hypothetical protein
MMSSHSDACKWLNPGLLVNRSELPIGSNYAHSSKCERARELIEYCSCCESIMVRCIRENESSCGPVHVCDATNGNAKAAPPSIMLFAHLHQG